MASIPTPGLESESRMLNRSIAVEPRANWKLAFGCATGENRDLHHPSCDSRDIGSLQGGFSLLIWDVGLRLLPNCIQNLVSNFPYRRPRGRDYFRLLFHRFVSERSPVARVMQGRFFQARSFSAVAEAPLPITSIPRSVLKWALPIQPDTALRLVVTNPFDIRSGNNLPLDGSASFQCPMNDVA